MGLLEISVAAGEPGPVMTLSGEADVTTVAELSETLTAQLSKLLAKLAAAHGLVPGIHPGYRTLGGKDRAS